MIKYKTITTNDKNYSIDYRESQRKKYPVYFKDNDSLSTPIPSIVEAYTIPFKNKYVFHREDGPAIIQKVRRSEFGTASYEIYQTYYWYDYIAFDKEQWSDSQWRKKIELKVFI